MSLRRLEETVYPVSTNGPDLWSAQAYIRWSKYGIKPEGCHWWVDCDVRTGRLPIKTVCDYHSRLRLPTAG